MVIGDPDFWRGESEQIARRGTLVCQTSLADGSRTTVVRPPHAPALEHERSHRSELPRRQLPDPLEQLAPVDVPWVAAMFEGVVPPWRREPENETGPRHWFINYM